MGNMDLYNAVRAVPKDAQKTIGAGRLKGMTDISPMWRIKTLTEQFGVCGFGWYYDVDKKWSETINDETAVFVDITLYVRQGGEWSKGIHGTGGSMLAAKERNGVYVSDEAYKKATTDAISVACKQLGIGADVYWQSDSTKYTTPAPNQNDQRRAEEDAAKEPIGAKEIAIIRKEMERTGNYLQNFVKKKPLETWDKGTYVWALKKFRDMPDKQPEPPAAPADFETVPDEQIELPFDM